MRRQIWAVLMAMVLVMIMTVDASAEKKRTKSGRIVQFSEWKDRKPHEAMINIIDLENFPPLEQVTVQQRTRNNNMTRQRIRFDQRKAVIVIDHLGSGFFNIRATDDVHSESITKEDLKKWWMNHQEKKQVTFDESRKVYSYGRRGGWVHAARIGGNRRSCVFGTMGLLSASKSAPMETYDTIISFRDCSGKRFIQHYETFFKSVKLVSSGYNR